jgi:hypothetical protein
VVLSTVNHLNSFVLELTVEDTQADRETIRPTGSHRFYRASDAKWVSAQELKPGDQLQGQKGLLRVVASTRVAGMHRVYNLTVEGEHVYKVSSLGVLVHNMCPPAGGSTPPIPSIPHPGNIPPTHAPGPGFTWRGSGSAGSPHGNWYNPVTKESLWNDMNHPPPLGPHWDYTVRGGGSWRWFPDGTMVPK